MLSLLPILFIAVACLYAMAGFGGGSTYIALLAISGLPLTVVPVISLACNCIVTSQGSYQLIKRGHAQWSILTPLLVGSIPSAFIGGGWRLPEEAFLGILTVALTLAGIAMLVQTTIAKRATDDIKTPGAGLLVAAGAALGLLAGITGIGGGIYLAPVMHLLGWARAHTIAACTSLFIALNSLAGLIGQLTKGSAVLGEGSLWILIGCPVAVLIGGWLGSYLLSEKLPRNRVRLVTATVILLVAARLWVKVLSNA